MRSISKVALAIIFASAILGACGGDNQNGRGASSSHRSSLDPSFGKNGIALIEQNSIVDNVAWVATDKNGYVYMAGATLAGSDSAFYILKLDSTGNPVSAFGNNGKVALNIDSSGAGGAKMFVLDNDGNIYVAGTTIVAAAPPNSGLQPQTGIVIAKLDASGHLMPTFGVGGKLIIDLGANYSMSSTALLRDGVGALYAVGNAITIENINGNPKSRVSITVFKLDNNGNLIRSFGSEGKAVLHPAATNQTDVASSATIDSRGNIYIAGSTQTLIAKSSYFSYSSALIAMKLDSKGNLDPGFGEGGKVSIAVNDDAQAAAGINAIGSDSSGNVYLAGAIDYRGGALMKLDSHGKFVETFGDGGKAFVDFKDGLGIRAMVIDSRDNIIVAGSAGGAEDDPALCRADIAVAKFDPFGQLVHNFASDGMTTFDLGRKYTNIVRAVTLDNQGLLYVAGLTTKQLCQPRPSFSIPLIAVARVFL